MRNRFRVLALTFLFLLVNTLCFTLIDRIYRWKLQSLMLALEQAEKHHLVNASAIENSRKWNIQTPNKDSSQAAVKYIDNVAFSALGRVVDADVNTNQMLDEDFYQTPVRDVIETPVRKTFNNRYSEKYYRLTPGKEFSTPPDADQWLAIDDSVAVSLSKSIRLACFITTREKNWHTKLKAVNETWGRRCDKMLYVMTSNITAPDVLSVSIPDDHQTLTEKIRTAFTHMRTHFLDQYDWFLKADDDTYVIIENLKFLLSHFNPNEGVVVGDHFKAYSPTGYMAGGAGYVLSKTALRRLVDDGYSVPGRCRQAGGSEDIETGRCLDKVGVSKYLSLDIYNRSAFHASKPEVFITYVRQNFVRARRVHKFRWGLGCCSQMAISFHYIDPVKMVELELLLYRISVFGRTLRYDKLRGMFTVQKGVIPRGVMRPPYPGERIEEYVDPTEWRRRNTTIYIQEKKPKRRKVQRAAWNKKIYKTSKK